MIKNKQYSILLIVFLGFFFLSGCNSQKEVSLKKELNKNLNVLCNDIVNLQNQDSTNPDFGAFYCKACSSYHTRAAEAVLPLAEEFKQSGDVKFLKSAVSAGEWLISQQQPDGSWYSTPTKWTGTTTDQVLAMAAAYKLIKDDLPPGHQKKWMESIKKAADWLVINMNHVFATINYCATTAASMMVAFQVVPDSAYVRKAKEMAMLVTSKLDDDYFLTGEGNRIRGTKYGVDLGYSMDMSLWGLGLYAKLAGHNFVNGYVKESLKRYVYFIWPDGSTDGSWGVRSSKWTTYGSFTADGCQILFALYSQNEPVYRTAAIANMHYLMRMRVNGMLTYGPNYYKIFHRMPCVFPTIFRAKNFALAMIYGDQSEGTTSKLPTQKIGWGKYFKTMDLALVRTKNFMTTITGYRYKDIRRGAEFKYMFRPSGGSVTNLLVKDYGYLEASGQTEYHRWESTYPELSDAISITPRIQFTDTNAYYTNLYEFDSHLEMSEDNGTFIVQAMGELKDRNRWEGGVAYVLTHKISNNSIEKKIRLRFHGQHKPEVKIIEPIVQYDNTVFKKLDDHTIQILGGRKKFVFELLSKEYKLEMGESEEYYRQPFPSLKGYPIIIEVKPDQNSFIKEVDFRIRLLD